MALKTMIKSLASKKAAYDKELKKIGKSVAKEVAKELGNLLPEGYCLHWTQGTPSFNDGDPCTFSVHDPDLKRIVPEKDEDQEREDAEDGTDEEVEAFEMDLDTAVERYGKKDSTRLWTSEDYSLPKVKNGQGDMVYQMKSEEYTVSGFPAVEGYSAAKMKALLKTWKSLPEDLMMAAFGDGAEVTVYPSGDFDNDDYYCE